MAAGQGQECLQVEGIGQGRAQGLTIVTSGGAGMGQEGIELVQGHR